MNIGQRIINKRKELNLTQIALAKMIGISATALHKIEEGKTKNPKDILKISNILGVDPAWLQFGTSENEVTSIALSTDETESISKYRQLNDADKQFMFKCIKGLVNETYKKC